MKDHEAGKEATGKVPNQRLSEIAAREETLILSLVLKSLDLMRDAAKCLPPDAFQSEIPQGLYGMAIDHFKAYGQLLTRQAVEQRLAAAESPERAAFWQSQYDSVFAEYIRPDTGEYGMLKAGMQARHQQRQAYLACQEYAEKLLLATGGQQEIVAALKAKVAGIVEYDDDYGFDEYTLSSLEAYQPDPKDVIAGDGWIRRGGACLLTGSTGIGKSVLVSQAAVCMTAGVPFLNVQVHAPVKVLYVQSENDAQTMQRDVLSIVANVDPSLGKGLVDANLKIVHAYGLSGRRFTAWLKDKAARWKADVIIIDHYQAYIEGGDINSSELALEWVRPMDALIKSLRVGLMLVCHTTKPQDRKGWNARESVYMAAGSSVVANWARTSCELTQDGGDGRYRLRFGKNAERNGLEDGDGHLVRDVYVEHSGNRAAPCWKASALQVSAGGEYDGAILNLHLGDPTLSLREIATRAGCGKSHVSNVLARYRETCPQGRPLGIEEDKASQSPRLSSPPQGGWTGGQTSSEGCPLDASGQSGQRAGQSETRGSTGATPSDDFLAEPTDVMGGVEGENR